MADSLLPIKERIVQNVVTTLEGVTTAAGANQSLIVERPLPGKGNRKRDSLAVVVQGNPKRIRQGEQGPTGDGPAYGHDEWLFPVVVVLTVTASESTALTDPVDTRINIITADVVKALMEDHTRGELAIDTEIGDPEQVDHGEANGSIGEMWLPIEIHYRTLENDDYSQ